MLCVSDPEACASFSRLNRTTSAEKFIRNDRMNSVCVCVDTLFSGRRRPTGPDCFYWARTINITIERRPAGCHTHTREGSVNDSINPNKYQYRIYYIGHSRRLMMVIPQRRAHAERTQRATALIAAAGKMTRLLQPTHPVPYPCVSMAYICPVFFFGRHHESHKSGSALPHGGRP